MITESCPTPGRGGGPHPHSPLLSDSKCQVVFELDIFFLDTASLRVRLSCSASPSLSLGASSPLFLSVDALLPSSFSTCPTVESPCSLFSPPHLPSSTFHTSNHNLPFPPHSLSSSVCVLPLQDACSPTPSFSPCRLGCALPAVPLFSPLLSALAVYLPTPSANRCTIFLLDSLFHLQMSLMLEGSTFRPPHPPRPHSSLVTPYNILNNERVFAAGEDREYLWLT